MVLWCKMIVLSSVSGKVVLRHFQWCGMFRYLRWLLIPLGTIYPIIAEVSSSATEVQLRKIWCIFDQGSFSVSSLWDMGRYQKGVCKKWAFESNKLWSEVVSSRCMFGRTLSLWWTCPPRPPRTMRAEDKLCEAAGVGGWTSACMQLIPIIIICAKWELIACRPLSGAIRGYECSFLVTFCVQIITCNWSFITCK